MNDFIFISLGIYIIFMFIAYCLSLYTEHKKQRNNSVGNIVTLRITVAEENESTPKVFESIYSAIHGLQINYSFWQKILGYRNERITLEIAKLESNILFYISCPKHMQSFVEGQIYAQYPDVEIDAVKNSLFNISKKSIPNAITADLGLSNPSVYPIKCYSDFGDMFSKEYIDPLASMTATIAQLNHAKDKAVFQLVIRPLDDKGTSKFNQCVEIIKNNKYLGIKSLQNFHIKYKTVDNIFHKFLLLPLFWIFSFIRILAIPTGEADTGEKQLDPIFSKGDKFLFETNLRILYLPYKSDKGSAMMKVREMVGVFKQFNNLKSNSITMNKVISGLPGISLVASKKIDSPFILNTEELSTLYHLPNIHVKTPNIKWVQSRKLEPPGNLPSDEDEITKIGKTNFRGVEQVYGTKETDRMRHTYIIGKTGMGKSVLLENMIISDLQKGYGVAVIDPHGDLCNNVLSFVPPHRTNDVIIFDPSDTENPVAFNMLEDINSNANQLIASGLVGVFKKLYINSWGPRLEHILRNAILSLVGYPNSTMLGIIRIHQDKDYRDKVVKKIDDPIVKSFWEHEYNKMQERQRVEAISSILNKVGPFLSSPIIRNIVGQPKSAINIREAMDNKKIMLINLSKGKIGEDNSALLGSMLITKFQLDAMSRADINEKDRVPFFLYVDEFQNFATDSFATILSEARKYKLSLTVANQYISQMTDEVRNAVFGNVGTILSFQVGYDDADYLQQQFREQVSANDLVSLNKYTIYNRLLIDGMPSRTFSSGTLPPKVFEGEADRKDKVIRSSRERYSTAKIKVEDKIKKWHESGNKSRNENDKKRNDKKGKPKGDFKKSPKPENKEHKSETKNKKPENKEGK